MAAGKCIQRLGVRLTVAPLIGVKNLHFALKTLSEFYLTHHCRAHKTLLFNTRRAVGMRMRMYVSLFVRVLQLIGQTLGLVVMVAATKL